MNDTAPAIFNDVLGPVMRGPSSSHVAGAARIAAMLRQALGGEPAAVKVYFDVNGSLPASHTGQGTDMGFACGLLGIPLTDSRVERYESLLSASGVRLEYCVCDYGAEHPNHYRMKAEDSRGRTVTMDAVSTGGGMMEIRSLNGFEVTMAGDSYELFLICGSGEAAGAEAYFQDADCVRTLVREGRQCIHATYPAAPPAELAAQLRQHFPAAEVMCFVPVLPTGAARGAQVPFRTAAELTAYNRTSGRALWELAMEYESIRGNMPASAVWDKAAEIFGVMKGAVAAGLAGTSYADRILPPQAYRIQAAKGLLPGDVMNHVIASVTAAMEAKSAMQVIVAAPTCGSAGCLPGTIIGIGKALALPESECIKGLLAAGLVGIFFTGQATFAAEVGGCQMECGAASGMAAAAAVQMMGGTAEQCLQAASMALQGLTGLVCDPVANRVEVPCLNKNMVAAMNALSSTNMILAGFDSVIPLDETILAMYDIGQQLPQELRCTLGGLGKTATSRRLEKELEEKRQRSGL